MTLLSLATRRVVVLALAAIVAGCSTLDGPIRREGAHAVDGRLSLHYKDQETGKEEALSGRFEWVDRDGDAELGLFDPLGQTVALVRSRAGRASVTFRDGRVVEGDSPETLTRETLGYTLPLSGLAAWLEGRGEAGRPIENLGDGRLRQDGWTLRFTAPDDAAAGTPPRRIDLYYPGPPVEIELRLVVDRRSG